jgi:hypothetical protein
MEAGMRLHSVLFSAFLLFCHTGHCSDGSDVLIFIKPGDMSSVTDSVRRLKEAGLEIRHFIPPHVLIGHVKNDVFRKIDAEKTRYRIVDVEGIGADAQFREYVLEYGFGANPSAYTLIERSSEPVWNGVLAKWDVQSLAFGTYTLRLVVSDTSENQSEARIVVDIHEDSRSLVRAPSIKRLISWLLP